MDICSVWSFNTDNYSQDLECFSENCSDGCRCHCWLFFCVPAEEEAVHQGMQCKHPHFCFIHPVDQCFLPKLLLLPSSSWVCQLLIHKSTSHLGSSSGIRKQKLQGVYRQYWLLSLTHKYLFSCGTTFPLQIWFAKLPYLSAYTTHLHFKREISGKKCFWINNFELK